MRWILAPLLLMILLAPVCCRRSNGPPSRSAEQLAAEKRLSAEIADHAAQIDTLKPPASGLGAVAEAKEALAVARQRIKELKQAQPENWAKAQVFAVIAVEKLRKAHADADAAAEQSRPAPARPKK